MMIRFLSISAVGAVVLSTASARAADEAGTATGAPPPEAKALAAGPKAPADAPAVGTAKDKDDGTSATVSAGGLLTTGNSRTLALTGGGAIDSRFDDNGVGASLLGNYGQGAAPGNGVVATAENIQGRLRYDRYVIEQASVFLLLTGRHDRFQGLDFRFNADPGFKYLFVKEKAQALWGEAGYDFQYDVRRDAARVVVDDDQKPILDASGQPTLLDKTHTDHSSRLFVGYRQAFNKEVTLSMGLEHLQSIVDSTRWRVNFETLLAAKIAGGLAFGFGFSARFDHEPLPGKKDLDTSANASLIYAFSDLPAKKEDKCPCTAPAAAPPPPCELPPPPPPESAPPASSLPAPSAPPPAPSAEPMPAASPSAAPGPAQDIR